ncbi:DDE-type integrase/transposase/recombinase [Herminiimonas contaminans]|uniref:Transposase family protein n=1 Tax=Herminiimonas contaminans TaxID=1111140 RepID=A0ABS0EW08_9BURK|nr:DDE-type integrase/transposase/recombinase [Herminiimonas contaminans]MBF8178037.1 transposase family protein [Herminiimonas contaminans]
MNPFEFQVIANSLPVPGLVLRSCNGEEKYLRITHVFSTCIYAIDVSDLVFLQKGLRPNRIIRTEYEAMVATGEYELGRLSIPQSQLEQAMEVDGSEKVQAAWKSIKPLIQAFSEENNLSRDRYGPLIDARAAELQVYPLKVRRLVTRYFFFGGIKAAFMLLPKGRAKGDGSFVQAQADEEQTIKRRRGPKAAITRHYGQNEFVPNMDDVNDMLDCLRGLLRKRVTFLTEAHDEYLRKYFPKRHPAIAAEWAAGKRIEPVTYRQFSYHVKKYSELADELSQNLRTRDREAKKTGTLHATGPGELYEIDSTGGRIFLVSSGDNPVVLGKPTIYLLIDRWSRYVVSTYISLNPPSYEEVKYALLVAFTSRDERFRLLGVDVTNSSWPVGRMPAVICPDRGSDFINRSFEQSVVMDMRIEVTPLPPYCPDGKAIVERTIREIKRRMASSPLRGTYSERPMDPITKRIAKAASTVAVHSLAEVYRELIEIIKDHNNRPHQALRRMKFLAQAGVNPVPKEVYLWGVRNITGLRVPPFSDEDYKRLLLATADATISRKGVRFKGRLYLPSNEAAVEMCRSSTIKSQKIQIRFDPSSPLEILFSSKSGTWPLFCLSAGGMREIHGITLEEEQALSGVSNLLWSKAAHDSRRTRVTSRTSSSNKSVARKITSDQFTSKEKNTIRRDESDVIKRALMGKATVPEFVEKTVVEDPPDWLKLEEAERKKNLLKIGRARKKR